MKYNWTEEEKRLLASDVEEPTEEFHDNWRILYFKLLETRQELGHFKGILEMKEEVNFRIRRPDPECPGCHGTGDNGDYGPCPLCMK